MEQNEHWQVIAGGGVVVSTTAEDLWENAIKYFKWCDEHPIKASKAVYVGRDAGKDITEKFIRPYSLKGLCLHCGITEEYLRDIRNQKDRTSLYFLIISRILYIIYTQNYELAAVGILNAQFVSKALNMGGEETTPSPIKVEIITGLPELSSSENEILEKLELEREILKRDIS
jgi:hypothetical protein